MPKVQRLFSETDTVANPPVALAADKFLEAQEAFKESKEQLENAHALLIVEMNRAMQYRIVQKGRELSIVNTDPKQRVKVKDITHKGKAGRKK